MEYALTNNKIGMFYTERYVKNTPALGLSIKEDVVKTETLKMSISEWKTTTLKAHLVRTKAIRDINIGGGTMGEYVVLHFVCDGQTIVEKNKEYETTIKQNTNNLFCTTTTDVNHSFKKDEVNSYFKIFLPLEYINSMVEKYPDLFMDLAIMIKNNCPFLKKENITTTLEMKMIIEQIKESPAMGNVAPLYFETKVQELLILQLRQVNQQNHAECIYRKHYKEQLNQARNAIEAHYQNPPTIAQLAQLVGMSETVLKSNFKSFFGTTIYGYLFDFRMNIAKKHLPDNSQNIAEIAYKSGYENPSHFTTAFRRKYGISPAEYRAKCR